MPCPVNLKQNITMGSKITNGLIDMKIHDMDLVFFMSKLCKLAREGATVFGQVPCRTGLSVFLEARFPLKRGGANTHRHAITRIVADEAWV